MPNSANQEATRKPEPPPQPGTGGASGAEATPAVVIAHGGDGSDEPPPVQTAPKPDDQRSELVRQLQTELKRVGCYGGDVNGDWDPASTWALETFNKHARTRLDTKDASGDALEAIKARTARVCPLICDSGYQPRGDRCVAVKRPAARPEPKHEHRERVVHRRPTLSGPASPGGAAPHTAQKPPAAERTCTFVRGAMFCY